MALRGNLRDFTITQLLNLINLAHKTGTLVIDHWDTVSAYLKETNPDPPRTDGQVVARAQFILA